MEEGATVGNLGKAYGDPEVLNSQGLGHLLVLFWTRSELKFDNRGRDYYFEYTIDPNKYHIIGCDEDQRSQLLLYKSNFVGFPNRVCVCDNPKGVIERVLKNYSPEMSPNILHYSEDEYPHIVFALSCGIRSSFCFPFFASAKYGMSGVMEIVSTCNQDVVTLKKFCQSFQGFDWTFSFPDIINLKDYAIKKIDHFLEVVSQTFHLPLTQCWRNPKASPYLVHQFSHGDFENLAPWCHFKDACFHTRSGRNKAPLGSSRENPGAFFCRNITELSITQYPFAHFAQNCGSISCFTIFLGSYGLRGRQWAFEFFLPPQEMDNYYPQTLLNSIWAKMKEFLPNYMLASGEQLGQVLSVKVINSSAHTEPEFFKLGQHDSSLPHSEGSEYTPTLNLFKNGTEHRSNSNSYEEAVSGESLVKLIEPQPLNSQLRRSEDTFRDEGNTLTSDKDELVEVSCDEDLEYAKKMLRQQTMKMLRQQVEEETMVPECEREALEQLTRISHMLFEDGTKQNEQVLGMTKSIPNIILHEEIATGEASNRPPNNDMEINYVDELEGESLVKLIEPQPLNSQLRRSEETFRDEGNTLASDKDELVEVSCDEDLEYAKTTASKRLEISDTSFTLENIRKHFGRPQKDAAESFGVSLSTFKRKRKLVGIKRWPRGKRKLIDNETGQRNFSSGMPHVQDVQDTPAVAPTGQELNNMDVKVMYNGVPIRFEIPTSSGITELENNVIERLPLKRKSFSIKYQDDEGDWVLIACDKDVQKCFEISRSLKKATIKMLLDPLVT